MSIWAIKTAVKVGLRPFILGISTISLAFPLLAQSIAQDEFEALLINGSAARVNRNLSQAIELLRQAQSLRPMDVRPLLELAVCYEWSGDLREARRIYQHILRMSPEHPGATLGYARVLRWQYEWDPSGVQYQRLLASPDATAPMRKEALLGLAQTDRMAMRLNDAKLKLEHILNDDPGQPEAQRELEDVLGTNPDHLVLQAGHRQGPDGTGLVFGAEWSRKSDIITQLRIGATRNSIQTPTIATDVDTPVIEQVLYAEHSRSVPQGQFLGWQMQYQWPENQASHYSVRGSWSDALNSQWRVGLDATVTGPDVFNRKVLAPHVSYNPAPGWDMGLTTFYASGGPNPTVNTVMGRIGWEAGGTLAQLYVSREIGQPEYKYTGVLQIPINGSYMLRLQGTRDTVLNTTSAQFSVSLTIPKSSGYSLTHSASGESRSWIFGADVPLRRSPGASPP